MEQNTHNKLDNVVIGGNYIGGNQTNNYISLYGEEEREFVVTRRANIKPVYYFTGREMELRDLRQKIESRQKSVLVSGMGGIGKTHICRKLFEEYQAIGEGGFFQYIGYVEYNGDMGSSLQECLRYKEQERPEANREAAWRELEHLASGGKLLLFVDNVNKTIKEDPELRRLNSIPGAIVLTSRRTSFGKEFEPYRIGFLNMEQCREIYEKIRFEDGGKKIAIEEVPDLDYIIEKLAAKHTITVEFLAHLARTKAWTTGRLRRELEEKGFRLEYMDDADELVKIQKSFETLYDMSGLTRAEQNILEAFSVFPYIPLPGKVCNQWLLEDAGISEENDILTGLYRKGWLQFDIKLESYALHPVFAQFIFEKCKPNLDRHSGLIRACQKCLKIPKGGSALECQKYISYAENMIEKLSMGNKLEQVNFISALAYLLFYIAEYKKAEAMYKMSLEIREKMLGEDHQDTAKSYNDLALVYKTQGEYKKAEELYEKSLRIKERVLGEEHLDTATGYNNLALVYRVQGEYKKAEELYEKSLRIREHVLGEEHPKTAASYNNLAAVYGRQGEYKRAEELYKKSLQIRERILGEEHLDTAMGYSNLAGIYMSQGEYKKAEKLCEKSLQIIKHVLGEEHPKTAKSYNNLAGVYESQGEYKKAEELYEKSLQISERVFGKGHLDTATSYNNLAGVYVRQGEYKKAEELYEKSLRIMQHVLGEEHSDTATGYNNLAYVYDIQGEYKKAEELYEKSLQISERVFGKGHVDMSTRYNNLAGVYVSRGEYKKAEALYEKSRQIMEHMLGEEHPNTATSYNNLAYVYDIQGEYKKAEGLYKKSLRIKERVLGEGHPDTARGYNNLAGMYVKQEEYELALFYYIKAYKIFINKLGIEHRITKVVHQSMEKAYAQWNPYGIFEQWLEEQMKEPDHN